MDNKESEMDRFIQTFEQIEITHVPPENIDKIKKLNEQNDDN